jgi:hypothetical protein
MLGGWQAASESRAKRPSPEPARRRLPGAPSPPPKSSKPSSVARSIGPSKSSPGPPSTSAPSGTQAACPRRDPGDAGQTCHLTRKDGVWPAVAQGKHDENEENRGWRVPWRGFREPRPDGADFRRRADQQHSDDGSARGDRPTGAATTQALASPYAPRYEERSAAAGPTIGVSATANEDNRLVQATSDASATAFTELSPSRRSWPRGRAQSYWRSRS